MKLKLASIRDLSAHLEALERGQFFADQAHKTLFEIIRTDLLGMRQRLEDARAELRRLREELENAEDYEDLESIRAEIEAQKERVERLKCDSDELAKIATRVRQESEALKEKFSKEFKIAYVEIQDNVTNYKKYYEAPVADRPPVASQGEASQGVAGETKKHNLPDLPNKLEWVRIDQLDWSSMPKNIPFNHADKTSMTEMMETFSTRLLPIMRARGTIDPDYLVKLDRAAGIAAHEAHGNPRSLAFAWRCLISGNDLIVLDAPNQLTGKSTYDWTSGRHRSLIAKSLGWSHVPARVQSMKGSV
ncbi:MAG: hypothetical protein AAFP81_16165 [Pseudomonadota bacterium]